MEKPSSWISLTNSFLASFETYVYAFPIQLLGFDDDVMQDI